VKKRSRALEKELADNSTLLRQWHEWHAEQRAEAVAGPHGASVAQLLDVLSSLTLRSGVELVTFIGSQDWSDIDFDTKFTCLHEIDTCITALREKAGMPPFDDGFPPERTTGFLIIRHLMTGT
jgi:hypothetical protein